MEKKFSLLTMKWTQLNWHTVFLEIQATSEQQSCGSNRQMKTVFTGRASSMLTEKTNPENVNHCQTPRRQIFTACATTGSTHNSLGIIQMWYCASSYKLWIIHCSAFVAGLFVRRHLQERTDKNRRAGIVQKRSTSCSSRRDERATKQIQQDQRKPSKQTPRAGMKAAQSGSEEDETPFGAGAPPPPHCCVQGLWSAKHPPHTLLCTLHLLPFGDWMSLHTDGHGKLELLQFHSTF